MACSHHQKIAKSLLQNLLVAHAGVTAAAAAAAFPDFYHPPNVGVAERDTCISQQSLIYLFIYF